ncbi:cytochrome c biogenesis protein ResB [Evansella cellulosilytica]|uniref:ResB family protein n=1 Tax=Evansella cellulosilytica (strain ATCC 21833 / DSM 2522 / FERM P-1141 / JCM 9156 / N-4) TaxID=649639 RepID=E6TYN4_EVAC2|nr:cytochrome c biogenesis protein ResB [Evansella cellulosilytica]ADU30084.1 ResB family protein [Evansella cellulosilytica DSM 2522]
MDKVKCECGHLNPYGTYLCESCGKPLIEEEGPVANMRYEGVARRSQTYKTTVIDKVWNFFSSVKVGIWIIVLLLLASAIGTIFPQEMYIPPGERATLYYEQEYGTLGKLYYQLGFHNLYSSWWYMLLIAALGISLVIASLDRVVPLYRALKNQRVTRHPRFLKRQRLYSEFVSSDEDLDVKMEAIEKGLRNKKYKVRKENGNILAEKGRFSRWGPYVNHLGIIIFLIGAMLRYFPEMYIDEHIWVREGDEVVIKGTDGEYFLRNDEFLKEFYDLDDERFQEAIERTGRPVVKTYQTAATLLRRSDDGAVGIGTELEEVKQHNIRVNDPLTFDSFSLYQVDYKENELAEFTFTLEAVNEDSSDIDLSEIQFTVSLYEPDTVYEFDNGFRIELMEYFPNFTINDGVPDTINKIPDNPRLIFEVFSPDMNHEEETGEISLIGIQVNEALNGENDYRIRMIDFKMVDVTALTVRKDRTLPILFVGGTIFMIGLVQGAYWHHRRMWFQKENGYIILAGHANKNWQALKKDFETVLSETDIPLPVDQTEETNSGEREGEKSKDD